MSFWIIWDYATRLVLTKSNIMKTSAFYSHFRKYVTSKQSSGAWGTFFFAPKIYFSLNIFRFTSRIVLIFYCLFDRATLGEHFKYLEHGYISSRKFSKMTWKKKFHQKIHIFRTFCQNILTLQHLKKHDFPLGLL